MTLPMQTETDLPQNRSFGLFFSAIFSLSSGYFFFSGSPNFAVSFFFFAVLFLLTALLKPTVLAPLNYLWMKFGYFLGSIVSPLVISLIYITVILPYGIWGKIINRDALKLKPINNESFWVVRENDTNQDSTFNDQF